MAHVAGQELEKALAVAEPLGVTETAVRPYAEALGQALHLELRKWCGRAVDAAKKKDGYPGWGLNAWAQYSVEEDGSLREIDEEEYEDVPNGMKVFIDGENEHRVHEYGVSAGLGSERWVAHRGPASNLSVTRRDYSLRDGLHTRTLEWRATQADYGSVGSQERGGAVWFLGMSALEESPSPRRSEVLVPWTAVHGEYDERTEIYRPVLGFKKGEVIDDSRLSPEQKMLLGIGVELLKGAKTQFTEDARQHEAVAVA